MIKISNETQLGNLIENQFGEHYLFSVNRNSFEQFDYKTQFSKEFDKTFSQKDTLYIIAGTDSGLMVKELIKNPPEKGSAYIFIEFPEVIELTKSQYDLSEHKRIIVSTEEMWQEDAMKIGLDIYFMINRVQRIKSFAAQYYFLNEYLFLWQVIDSSANHLSWQYQSQLGSKTFVQRQLENLAENHSPALILKDYFKGKSALILAGGPSLDNYIEWIEEHQEKFVVIAVTRIARRLLQTKIKPDIFVSVDPYVSNFNVSKEVFHFESDSILVNQFHINPMLLGNWLGVNFYLGDLFPWKSELNQENLPGIGPTVTNTAILLALKMGIKHQILFGVDLCYSPDGFTHAKGSNEHDNGPNINEFGQIVVTNNGDKAETNSAYFEAITTIEQLAELAHQLGCKLSNASPNAAKMINVDYVSIDDIALDEEHVGISNILEAQNQKNITENFKVIHYEKILKELNAAQFKVNKIEEIAKKGLEYNEKFFLGDNPEANFKFKLKMDKLEKELNHNHLTHFTELSKKFGVNEFLYFLNPDSDRELTNEEIKESGKIYYKALKTGASELAKHIFTAINRTEIRLLEQKHLIVNNDIINRHLNAFDKSTLLNRAIENQQFTLNKIKDKQTNEQIENNKNHLELLIQDKKQTTENCNKIYLKFKNNDKSLGINDKERKQAVSFYIFMLQNEQNYQTRRLTICNRENPELIGIPDNIQFEDKSPSSIVQIQQSINRSLRLETDNENLIKLKNQISNVSENYLPIKDIKDLFKESSAIILTDSASLLKYKNWIEKHQTHFVIISLSHLAKDLMLTDINPDFFIASASNEIDFDNNKSIIHYEKYSILIHQNYFLPKILGNWLGHNIYLGNLLPWESKLNINDIFNSEKNSITNAINYLPYIGIKQGIIFSDNISNLTKSLSTWCDTIKIQLITEAPSANQDNILQQVSINKINIPKESINTLRYLENKNKELETTQRKINHYKQTINELNRTYKNLQSITEIINSILSLNQQLSDTEDDETRKTLASKMILSKKSLEQVEYTSLIEVSKQFVQNHSLATTSKGNSDIETYQSLKLGLYSLSREIFTAINCIEVRLLEQNSQSIDKDLIKRHLCSFDKLAILDSYSKKLSLKANYLNVANSYFNNDIILGSTDKERDNTIEFFIMIKNYAAYQQQRRINILEANKSFLSNFSKTTRILRRTPNSILKNQKRIGNNAFDKLVADSIHFEGIEIKLYNLFTLKDISAIQKIIYSIELIDEIDPENLSYLHLAKGYLLELQSKVEESITEYGQAEFENTRESALKRIAYITLSMGEINYAYDTLQLLSEISPTYLPQLAELCCLTKNYKDAIDIYSQYLDYNQSDITVLLKVGKLYEDQSIYDGAEFIYNQVINLEPENEIAKTHLSNLQHIL